MEWFFRFGLVVDKIIVAVLIIMVIAVWVWVFGGSALWIQIGKILSSC
jgi:hypothetical protein